MKFEDETENGKGRGRGRGREENPESQKPLREVGITMPSSQMICGLAVGMRDKHSNPAKTYSCYVRECKDKRGHEKWECPTAFAAKYPGKRMPGFTDKGDRILNDWDGDTPIPTVRQQWQTLIDDGFFRNHPSPKSNFPFPDPTKLAARGADE